MNKLEGTKNEPTEAVRPRKWIPRLGALAWLFVTTLALLSWVLCDWLIAVPEDVAVRYVGRSKCVNCHQSQLEQWEGSHHDKAMDEAVEANYPVRLPIFRNTHLFRCSQPTGRLNPPLMPLSANKL